MVLRWVCMQPFGSPVVPDVYGMTARSSGPIVKAPGDNSLRSASRQSVTPGRDSFTRGTEMKSGTGSSVGTFR